jgi:8-oxo-dGTP pyrophosphatase MutT (NUDIX family)
MTGTTHGWGIPKGKVDEDEGPRPAALREFYEETNLDLSTIDSIVIMGEPFFNYPVKLSKKRKKIVYVYRAFDPLGITENFPFKCVSYVEHTNIPELDKFCWVTAEEACDIVTASQIPLFKKVVEDEARP